MIEAPEVLRIGGDHWQLPSPSATHHGGIDHVRGTSHPQELAGLPGTTVVKRHNLAAVAREQPCQSGLESTVSPDLGQHADGNGQQPTVVDDALDQGDRLPLVSLIGDQSSGVQDKTVGLAPQYPKRASASAISLSVNGPPVSSSISASKA